MPAATRPERMGRIGPAVAAELNRLQPSLVACFDEDLRAGRGQEAGPRPLPPGSHDESDPTLLVLNLELEPGQIRIADAPVHSQGPASDVLIACAQKVLNGRVIQTNVVTGPGRARLALPLVR